MLASCALRRTFSHTLTKWTGVSRIHTSEMMLQEEEEKDEKGFSDTYQVATENINEQSALNQVIIKMLMSRLRFDEKTFSKSWKLIGDPIIPREQFDEPLIEAFNMTENKLLTEVVKPLPKGEGLEQRQGCLYQMALELELPGIRVLPEGGFEEFITNRKLKIEAEHFAHTDDNPLSMKTLNRVMLNMQRKGNEQAAKLRKKESNEIRRAQDPEVKKTQRRPAIMRYINRTFNSKYLNQRLLSRSENSQPLFIDMRFHDEKLNKVNEVVKQLTCLHSINRSSANPFRMIYANMLPGTRFEKLFQNMTQADGEDGEMYETTQSSYTDMEDLVSTDQLVYLSPDSENVMTHFELDKAYIIGGLVDGGITKSLTRTTALNEKIATMRLPLEKYLLWGGVTGRKDLSLDIVLKVLQTLRDSGSWIKALEHIPGRFHRGLTEEGMLLCGNNEEVIEHFLIGDKMYQKKLLIRNPPGAHKYGSFDKYFGR